MAELTTSCIENSGGPASARLPTIGKAKGDCIFCGHPLRYTLVDLGLSPLCENWLSEQDLHKPETFYPLHAFVCEKCFLVQVEEYVHGEDIFGGDYGYFSSFSTSWLEHAARYVEMITKRLSLDSSSLVVELASNDGYLLKNFVARGIPNLGIEPAANCAAEATKLGVNCLVKFFGVETAQELRDQGQRASLLIANNVLAHVPDLNDFVAGMKILLADDGVLTVEFPHLVRQMEENQFDTIYQEHYCYYSLYSVEQVFAAHGITLFDVETLPTHGGSLRIYGRHVENEAQAVTEAYRRKMQAELEAGINDLAFYACFSDKVAETKRKLLHFLIEAKRQGKTVVGYGAPGKASTLLNYCGVRTDMIDYLVDRNPYKHGRYMPGVRIPIHAPEHIDHTRPDYILILPWNLKDEISEQLAYTREWGAQFVVPIPEVQVF